MPSDKSLISVCAPGCGGICGCRIGTVITRACIKEGLCPRPADTGSEQKHGKPFFQSSFLVYGPGVEFYQKSVKQAQNPIRCEESAAGPLWFTFCIS